MMHELQTDAAFAYARAHGLHAAIVARRDVPIAAEYGEGYGADVPHALYSGTKSFWGVAALYAAGDGLLDLDERVADTIERWRDDPWKRSITPANAAVAHARVRLRRPGRERAGLRPSAGVPLEHEPGTRFTYGGIPLQAFGAVLRAQARSSGRTPHEYLRERILDPAGVRIASWRTLSDGTHPLPTGAFLTAEDWLAYGRFVLRQARVAESLAFEGSSVNARYGLGWWLGARGAPADLVYASGAAGQALYLVPSLDLADRALRQKRVVPPRRLREAALFITRARRSARVRRHSGAANEALLYGAPYGAARAELSFARMFDGHTASVTVYEQRLRAARTGSTGAGKIKHVVYIVQENRSFDNLFHGYPGANTVPSGKNSHGDTIDWSPGRWRTRT